MTRKAFILIDADNFYCSCERVWRPELWNKPVVVAGSGDGCVIARSPEAKSLGIKMSDPVHLVREEHWRSGLIICSANFPLYGDLSSRMMRTIAPLVPALTVYSIDEAFCLCDGMSDDQLHQVAVQIRARVLAWCGLGTGAGIGPTPTQAKLASNAAKRVTKTGLVNLMQPEDRLMMLHLAPVSEVWGIGPAVTEKLRLMGINTAAQFAQLPRHIVEREFPVTVLRTQLELNGVCAVPLTGNDGVRDMINVSRSFTARIESEKDLVAATVDFAARASAKLRKQGSVASAMRVYARTSPFDNKQAPYAKTVTVPFSQPVADARVFARSAAQAARSIYRPGVRFSKVGILLMGLQSATEMHQQDMFGYDAGAEERVMGAIDQINAKYGRGTVKLGRSILSAEAEGRGKNVSPAFSCRASDLKLVY